MSVPRNNPGNLRYVPSIKWKGQVGQQNGYCVYSTLNYGSRALVIDLRNAERLHHRNTVSKIVTAYAPPNENDTSAYISAVCNDMKVGPDTALDLNDKQTVRSLAAAVWHHEQGQKPDAAALDYGVAAAFGLFGFFAPKGKII